MNKQIYQLLGKNIRQGKILNKYIYFSVLFFILHFFVSVLLISGNAVGKYLGFPWWMFCRKSMIFLFFTTIVSFFFYFCFLLKIAIYWRKKNKIIQKLEKKINQ